MNTQNRLVPFAFNDALVRVHMDENGNPWFVGKDVCRVLEIENHLDAISSLDEDERGVANTDPLSKGGAQQVRTVSESGLYSLIFRSRKPEARRFRKWVTSEVLPALRKTGTYTLSGHDPDLEIPDLPLSVRRLKSYARVQVLHEAVQAAKMRECHELIDPYFYKYCQMVSDGVPPEGVYAKFSHDKGSLLRDFISDCCTISAHPDSMICGDELHDIHLRWCAEQHPPRTPLRLHPLVEGMAAAIPEARVTRPRQKKFSKGKRQRPLYLCGVDVRLEA